MLMPEDLVNEEPGILDRIRHGEQVDHYETVRCHKDGTLLDISLNVSPVVDAHGVIIGASKIARDITHKRRIDAATRESEIMHRLVEAQEAERHRIARDLHDHLGQKMTALRLQTEALSAKCADDPSLAAAVLRVQKSAVDVDRDIGFLSWELRPTELENLGLENALTTFVREWSGQYGIKAEFHTSKTETNGNGSRLDHVVETNLYRIVQEALNNVLKHADAKSVSVLLHHRKDEVVLIVEDNGCGFDEAMGAANGATRGGLGLVGMKERSALLNGVLEIDSQPGTGTTVVARIPLN